MNMKGVGIKQDEQKTVEHYNKAAEQWYVKAQNKLFPFSVIMIILMFKNLWRFIKWVGSKFLVHSIVL